MGMREEFESAGNWLFRRRGYLPLLLFPMLLVAAARTEATPLGAGWEALCVGLALGGLALRAATVGFVPKDTSQRNTGRPQAEALNTTGMYSVVRHPLYLGFLIGFWSTPVMTWTHLAFAAITTAYILVAIQLEERDLMAEHPDYRRYRQLVPMLIPSFRRGQTAAVAKPMTPAPATVEVRTQG